MSVIAIIFGFLLLVFGGGCTLIFLYGAVIDTRSMFSDVPALLMLWLPLGLLPMVLGWLLFRWGRRRDRERLSASADIINQAAPATERHKPDSGSTP